MNLRKMKVVYHPCKNFYEMDKPIYQKEAKLDTHVKNEVPLNLFDLGVF